MKYTIIFNEFTHLPMQTIEAEKVEYDSIFVSFTEKYTRDKFIYPYTSIAVVHQEYD